MTLTCLSSFLIQCPGDLIGRSVIYTNMTVNKNNGQTQTITQDQVPVIGSGGAETMEWSPKDLKREASWPSVLFYIHLNILGLYGIVVLFSHTSLLTIAFSKWPTLNRLSMLQCLRMEAPSIIMYLMYVSVAATILTFLGIIGVTCGAHRLWAHRTYKATPALRVFLMLCQTAAGQVRKSYF